MSDPLFLLMIIGLPLASQFAAKQLRARFVQFSREPLPYTGREIAEMMLRSRNIGGVQVTHTPGALTDHYDPRDRTVNLSEVVYQESNIAAAAVAAHEVGHAVQHATKYPLLTFRSKLVPLLKIANMALPLLAVGGAVLSAILGEKLAAYLCIGVLALPALFSFVTLPVEFDASRRALKWMEDEGIAVDAQHERARKALWWAAMTYVIAALGSVAQVAYFARFFLRGIRR